MMCFWKLLLGVIIWIQCVTAATNPFCPAVQKWCQLRGSFDIDERSDAYQNLTHKNAWIEITTADGQSWSTTSADKSYLRMQLLDTFVVSQPACHDIYCQEGENLCTYITLKAKLCRNGLTKNPVCEPCKILEIITFRQGKIVRDRVFIL